MAEKNKEKINESNKKIGQVIEPRKGKEFRK